MSCLDKIKNLIKKGLEKKGKYFRVFDNPSLLKITFTKIDSLKTPLPQESFLLGG